MMLIRRAVGYGPWAVAAALGLEIANPTFAAPPVGPTAIPVAAVASSASVEDVEAATNVQVAWLADPGLFLCNLSAVPTAKGLELQGFVTSEPAHQKALAIARALCTTPINDQLKLQNNMPIQMSRGAAPAELATAASSVLAEALGDKILGLRVVCPSAGRVEVSGHLPTLEDKLRVSKCMKTLTGCTHVINRTNAPGSSAGSAIVANIPLMITKPAGDSATGWKSVQEPVLVTQTTTPTFKPIATRNESTTPAVAPRLVVTPPVKNPYEGKTESKTSAYAQVNTTKPGYAAISDTKPVEFVPAAPEAVKLPDPVWPVAKIVVPETKPADVKPFEVAKVAASVSAPGVRSDKLESARTTGEKTNFANPAADAPKFPAVMPPVDGCDRADVKCDLSKTEVVAKPMADVPPPPKPIIVPPIMPPVFKSSPIVELPHGSTAIAVAAPIAPIAVAELPKPADLPKPIDMPKPVVEVTTLAGKASVTDIPKGETPEVVEMPKAVAASPIEMPKPVSPPVIASEPQKPSVSKVERFTAPTVSGPIKSMKEPVSLTLDAETARRAVEDVCRGAGTDLKVTSGPNRQITIGCKVGSQGEWDRLYAKVKALPEINGYSVTYNAQVEGSTVKPTSYSTPAPDVASKSSTAPMMGVLRSNAGNSTPTPEAAKCAIEKLCDGKAAEVNVRTPAGRQVAVSMKVACAADWEMLYAQIKALPEIAGCSVIYNISVK